MSLQVEGLTSFLPSASTGVYLHLGGYKPHCLLSYLEKGMATYSSILAWKTLQTEEPGKLWYGVAELGMTEQLTTSV